MFFQLNENFYLKKGKLNYFSVFQRSKSLKLNYSWRLALKNNSYTIQKYSKKTI